MTSVPVRFMTTSSFLPAVALASTNWMFSYRTTPSCRVSCVDCSETRLAVPPMWNVRIVSCVPGSPIDWAAMTPTACPISTILPVARSRP